MDVMESRGYIAVYDLLNCPIPDYSDCPETAQSCVHNSSFDIAGTVRRYHFIQPIR